MRRSKGSGKGHAAEGRPYGEEPWHEQEEEDHYQGHADWMKGKKGKRGQKGEPGAVGAPGLDAPCPTGLIRIL